MKKLIGSGERIALFALPFLIIGVGLNVFYPSVFSVGGPGSVLRAISIIVLVIGIVIWGWSAALILIKVPKNELITNGPFSLVKHPLYTNMALLVIPWIGFLLNSWLGVPLGIIVYIATRKYAPQEEEQLAKAFGAEWDRHIEKIMLPWL